MLRLVRPARWPGGCSSSLEQRTGFNLGRELRPAREDGRDIGEGCGAGQCVAIVEDWAHARVGRAAHGDGNAAGWTGLEELRGGVSGQHVLQHAAVIGIGQAA
jgi:hypothetical protein